MKLETITRTFLNTVNGRPVSADATFESFNPATSEVIGHVARSSVAQVHDAVTAARAAQPAWAARPDAERKALMLKVAQTIEAHADELALWVTREQGKPLGGLGPGQVPGARFEVMGCKKAELLPELPDLAGFWGTSFSSNDQRHAVLVGTGKDDELVVHRWSPGSRRPETRTFPELTPHQILRHES